jgi:hypothetical protein
MSYAWDEGTELCHLSRFQNGEKNTVTGFRHSEIGYEFIQGTGAQSGKNPAALFSILPNLGRFLVAQVVGGK